MMTSTLKMITPHLIAVLKATIPTVPLSWELLFFKNKVT